MRGMNLNNGSIFFQGIIDSEGEVYFYETGFRLNGAQEHILMSYLYGIDAKELYINYALGGKVSDQIIKQPDVWHEKRIACKLSPVIKEGVIKEIRGIHDIQKIKQIIYISPCYEVGMTVSGGGTLKQIFCRIYVICETMKEMKTIIERIFNILTVIDTSGNDMIVGRFEVEDV